MVRRDEVTNRVRIVNFVAGTPAHITIAQSVIRPDGKTRTISQKVPINDPCLAQRVQTEIGEGAEIQATIVTEWSNDGYRTYLSGFCLVAEAHFPTRTSLPGTAATRK